VNVTTDKMMRTWRVPKGCTSIDQLELVEVPRPVPGPGEVRVRVHACSLNYRDKLVAEGKYFGGPVVAAGTPLSDGAGVIDAVGDGVDTLKAGDRVAGAFFQEWLAGPPTPNFGAALGAPPAPGMLADHVVLPATGVYPIATSLSIEEAATLPCAGVTAWSALMRGIRPLREGGTVLVLGSGGVSTIALLIARAAGARVIATSSSPSKSERLKTLGAEAVVNYREQPAWGQKAAELVGGGFDHVVELGGAGTLAQSMQAVGFGGEIALIGVLAGDGQSDPKALMAKNASLRGIFVGSVEMATELNAFVDAHRIKPVIDRVFDFEAARDAYAYQASPELFGKVVIANPD
jgi:NADPH:quinone reductase-like Zn-dependent oxidoreductase